MSDVQTLAQALDAAARSGNGIRYLQRGGAETAIGYAQLAARAAGLLGVLQDRGAPPGARLVILVRDSVAFVDAFWACQLGGMVAVPLPAGLQAEYLRRLDGVARLLETPWIFTERELFARLDSATRARFADRVLLLDTVGSLDAAARPHAAQAGDIALIQFSSGSTSEPKGVQLSHANLLANMRAISAAAHITAADATLSWMPLSHDMGLIGFHLVPLYNGLAQTLMDTELFVRRPARWLETAQRTGATLLCAPNFGYQHYLKAVPAPDADLDLGGVRLIFNGAEPVSAPVCRAFLQRLAPCGLDAGAMFPVYGLAEASLAVAFPRPGSGVASLRVAADSLAPGARVAPAADAAGDTVELVCLGHPLPGCELRICDARGAVQETGVIGRVQIRGASVTRGYYRCPACDAAAFHDGWLDTGDLGAMTADGLLVAGRADDVLFVHGQNRYPQDIEQLLEERAGVDSGKVAVCALRDADNAEDRVLVFVQHRRGLDAFVDTVQGVQAALGAACGLHAHAVVPVHALPRTSSGKLQRYRLARAFRHGEYAGPLAQLDAILPAARREAAGDAVESRLLELCREVFRQPDIEARQNLFELGADSLLLVGIHERIDAEFPGRVEITDLFDYPTVAELAAFIRDGRPA